MRARMAAGAALMIAALTMGLPTAAYATDPVSFGESHILDTVGALGDREGEVTAALDQLYGDTRLDLFVVYVDSFTGAADRAQWADQTADENGLGATDVLLAVATEDREYQLSAAPDFTLTDAQLAEVESVAIEPALRENDWAGAAIGAATGLLAAASGVPVETGEVTPGEANPGGSGAGGIGIILVWVLVVAVIGAIVFFLLRRARRTTRQAGPTGVPTAQLKQQAGSALVQTDDAIKTSEEDLGFAIAQYGPEATRAFQSALDAARAQLTSAFTLQQRLDDAEPDTEEQRRAWYSDIARLCSEANAALDEQAEDFDELRQLETRAPEAAASVARDFAVQEARVAPAESALTELGTQFTPSALATVADNTEQARDRLDFAQATLDEATARIAAGERGAAAVGIRAAEESVDQSMLLLDAIDRLGADLQAAAASIPAIVSDLKHDLVSAHGLPSTAAAAAALPGVIADSERILAEIAASLDSGPISPLDLMRKLEYTNAQMDAALQGVRDATAQAQRAQAVLAQTLLAARSQVSAAADFVTARRGAVGPEARTRLAEAGRFIALAEATPDPSAALRDAQRANALAADALNFARNDVAGFSSGAGDGLGELFGGGRPGSGGNGSMGAVLGGLLIGSLLGGGGGGGGIFGGGGGRRGGGGIFGGGFGGRSPGSFGGGGTRSRRGGGGRF